MTTEIYSCKDGQELRDGRLDYSSDITTRDEAEVDAKQRCQKDQTLKRIAYYSVEESGRFRNFYTYNNPNARPAGKSSSRPGDASRRKKPATPPPPPKGLVRKILEFLGLAK
ncbi:MAG: hypothetical protein HQL37_09400 [Alphaproteobacteria bacterium]|nr:hypothetical protein [Alphaproteobacteria bacterium]